MSSFEVGRMLGRIVGAVVVPLLLAWFGVRVYEKLRKTRLARRTRTIAIVAIILFVLGLVGNAVGRSGTAQPTKKLSPTDLQLVTEPGVSLPNGWKYYEFADMGFGVAFPGQPQTATVTAGDGTPVRVIGIEYQGNGLTATAFKDQSFAESKRADFFRGVVEGARQQMNGRVTEETDLEFAGFPAHSFVIENDTQRSRGIVVAVSGGSSGGVRIVSLLSLARKEDADHYERFIGSFKALAR